MRGGRLNEKTKEQISEIRPKVFLLLQAEGTMSTLDIAERLGLNANVLGTVLQRSQLSFEVKLVHANNLKRRMVSLKTSGVSAVSDY